MAFKIDTQMVRVMRIERSWSQEDLAAAAGLSPRTVQRVESDGRASLETRKALAAAFDVQVSDLKGNSRTGGAKCGLRFAIGGASLGFIIAFSSVTHELIQGGMTGAEAGATMGALGVAIGAVCALIGWLGRRTKIS